MSDFVSHRKKLEVGTRQKSYEKATSSSDIPIDKMSAEGSMMKYKMHEKASDYMGSEEYFEYCCDPCSSVGEHLEAEGFCTQCEEYLCGTCFRSHSRGKATRNHTLLDKDNMPRKIVKTCDPCKTAGEEVDVVGYCGDCDEYLCSSCFRSHSRSKATKHHNLIDKEKMPGEFESTLASSVSKMNLCVGSIESRKKDEEYAYLREINIMAKGDKYACYITEMTLVSKTRLVLADYNNKSLKVVDTENRKLKGRFVLPSKSLGLTAVGEDRIAVVLENACKILIVSVLRDMSIIKTLRTNGVCLGIKYINGKLYVSFRDPVIFQILELTGVVKQTIHPHSEVLKFCIHPENIEVSPDGNRIYVLDIKTNKVFCIDLNGNLLCVCQDKIGDPCFIIMSSCGSVCVSDRENAIVYKVTHSLTEAVVLLGRGDGLVAPQAMVFNAHKQQLYISGGSDLPEDQKFIKVFERK